MNKKEFLYLSGFFLFFVIICALSPISGDDWHNYWIGEQGLRFMLGHTKGSYLNWEGRITSTFYFDFFTYYKWIWNILNPLLITGVLYCMLRIVKPKNKKTVYALALLSFLAIPFLTFSEVIVYIAGNATFLVPQFLILFYIVFHIDYKVDNKMIRLFFILYNIALTLFVEHLAVFLVIINMVLIGQEYFTLKKINRKYLSYLIASIVGVLLLVLSPGTTYRNSVDNAEFHQLPLIDKIVNNLPNFVHYTFMANTFLLFLFVLSSILLIRKLKHNIVWKLFLALYMILVPVVNIVCHYFVVLEFWDPKNAWVIGIWIFYGLLFIYLCTYLNKAIREKIILFLLLAIMPNVIMLMSPISGPRTGFATLIFLYIVLLMIIDSEIQYKKWVNFLRYGSIGASSLLAIFYIVLYISIYRQQLERDKSIREQAGHDIIYIEKFPDFINYSINPEHEYHVRTFKEYYHLPEDVKIELTPNTWKYKIIYE
jgi:hypothetical protein